MPFLRDKEDVFLLPTNEREEDKEVKEEEEIISRVSKLGYSHSLLLLYTHFVLVCAQVKRIMKRKKERKKVT